MVPNFIIPKKTFKDLSIFSKFISVILNYSVKQPLIFSFQTTFTNLNLVRYYL
nr:MAG TPA: hypothetical protein [Caudoviricetes sp.]